MRSVATVGEKRNLVELRRIVEICMDGEVFNVTCSITTGTSRKRLERQPILTCAQFEMFENVRTATLLPVTADERVLTQDMLLRPLRLVVCFLYGPREDCGEQVRWYIRARKGATRFTYGSAGRGGGMLRNLVPSSLFSSEIRNSKDVRVWFGQGRRGVL